MTEIASEPDKKKYESGVSYLRGRRHVPSEAKIPWLTSRFRVGLMARSPRHATSARAISTSATDPVVGRQLTLSLSAGDKTFAARVADGDAARDAGNPASAEYFYWKALQLYPLHSGYMVQYAHALKDQEKYLDAELFYRQSLPLGESLDAVQEHLAYVAHQTGHHIDFSVIDRVTHFWFKHSPAALDTPLRVVDVRSLVEVLLNRTNVDHWLILDAMRRFASRGDYARSLITQRDFTINNRDLLKLIAETGWGKS
ncbi:hypothetical protein [Lichenihabitans psoromatis]|uniref:hypothetical protein n=1 Tax=Lichenihabitans psoromatis TaxID=2528642 RepID=UPI0010366C16|nr:hypothetical protein [Lichenihabitans psoromatis]